MEANGCVAISGHPKCEGNFIDSADPIKMIRYTYLDCMWDGIHCHLNDGCVRPLFEVVEQV